ncbi:MAG: hypothetical protein D6811_06805, partial [Alphaproteobacteria bacterium]
MEDALARIRLRYVEQLEEHAPRLSAVLAQLMRGTASAEVFGEVQFRAHKLHGTAATLGFAALGARAAECEHEAQAGLAAGRLTTRDAARL